MFTRFTRDSTATGSGIGLYLVKKQLKKMNGSINVKSKVNVGTQFNIILPYNTKENEFKYH